MRTRTGAPGEWTSIVGANVKRLREQHGLSLRDLAAELAGLDYPLAAGALSEIERGLRRIDVEDVVRLAAVFGLDPHELLMTDRDRQRMEERKGMIPAALREELEAELRVKVLADLTDALQQPRVRNPDRSRGRG